MVLRYGKMDIINKNNVSDTHFYKKKCNKKDAECNELPPGYIFKTWRPGFRKPVPDGVNFLPFFIWWLFHYLRIFSNRNYLLILVYKDNYLVHRTSIFPRYFRFPFMNKRDLQIGATWTCSKHRGKGIATYCLNKACTVFPQSVLWYLVHFTNIASIKVVEKVGFDYVGQGVRKSKYGLKIFGNFTIEKELSNEKRN